MGSDSRGPEILLFAWLFTGAAIIVVSLRFFTKFRITDTVGWDDFFILLSIVSLVSLRLLAMLLDTKERD